MRHYRSPLQQGDLDFFCDLYAIINFLELTGDEAFEFFRFMILRIDAEPGGSVALTAIEGLEEGEIVWLAEKCDLLLEEVDKVTERAIVFLEAEDKKLLPEYHYSVAEPQKDGSLKLHDSYGFTRMTPDGADWMLHWKGDKAKVKLKTVYQKTKS